MTRRWRRAACGFTSRSSRESTCSLAAESDLEEQQPTPRAPLDCLTPTLDAKLIVGDVGQESGRRKRRNQPRIDNGDGGSRCWQAAREEICCHTPLSLAGLGAPRCGRGAWFSRKRPYFRRAWVMFHHLAQLPAVYGLRQASAATSQAV